MSYAFIGILAGVFVPIYALKNRRDRIRETGTDALGEIEMARDLQGRLTEGAHRLYEMKLQIRITGHRKSPYTVTDKFWVSEFYIHRLSSDQPVPVKVDRINHRLIALNFGGQTEQVHEKTPEIQSGPEDPLPPGEKMILIYESLEKGALYNKIPGFDSGDYAGCIFTGAQMELLDRRVYSDEFEQEVIFVKLLSNDPVASDDDLSVPAPVNSTGWTELDGTSLRNRYDKANRVIREV